MPIVINGTSGISGIDGSAAAPALQGTDSNTGIVFGTDTIAISTNGSGRLFVNSSGSVGIGTSSPSQALHVVASVNQALFEGGTQGNITIQKTGTLGMSLYSDGAGKLTFYDNAAGVNRVAIDSSGRLLVGTSTSPASNNDRVVIQGSSTTNAAYSLGVWNSASASLFAVRNDGAIYTGLTTSSPYNLTTGSAANAWLGNDGFLYRSTSSLKYKRDIVDYDKGLQEVLSLRPVYYKGKSERDGDTQFAGLIAEEVDGIGLAEFVQYAEDGSPDALAYGQMVSLLTKAIQEQQVMITELQAKVAALEAA